MARASSSDEYTNDAVEHRVLGSRLRAERQRRSLSLRELARRINVSASLVSQIETGRVRPSVSTLMALVTELELSLDNLFSPGDEHSGLDPAGRGEAESAPGDAPPPDGHAATHRPSPNLAFDHSGLLPPLGSATWVKSDSPPALIAGPFGPLGVERAGNRAYLELESGVRWERLTPYSVPGMEFLYVRYEIGASSTAAGKHTRHQGIEFGYVTSGCLHITVGFDEVVCDPGSSIMFDAATPHRLENRGDIPAEAVWLIIGRQSSGIDAH
jgi:transcriptional regulator with XRE-family HTH domain/mannose-6-phosphate isomerase-like protein (cupin superfamily)